MSFQVTALLLCGGIRSLSEIGAVVDGESCDSHTPLSGQISPVLASVPSGFRGLAITKPPVKKKTEMGWGLIKSFGIDNGELDGLRRNECFVLGYELALIDDQLKQPEPFARYVHVENRERVEKSCRDAGRSFVLNWMEGDSSESWLWLMVAEKC